MSAAAIVVMATSSARTLPVSQVLLADLLADRHDIRFQPTNGCRGERDRDGDL